MLRHLVLAGAGHAHAQVLRAWAQAPLPGVRLTLVSPDEAAPYSGMVPGWLAGAYRADQIVLDMPALCAAAGATWQRGSVVALQAGAQRLQLDDGTQLPYDLLSLNIGSTLRPPALPAPALAAGVRLLAMRPLQALLAAWSALLADAARGQHPLRVTAVGGGAAGVETLLAALARLRALQPGRSVQGRLVSHGQALLPGLARGAARAAMSALQRAGVVVQLGQPLLLDLAPAGDPHHPGLQPGELLLWATGAQPHAWPGQAGLALDAAGFVQVDAQLRSVSHPQVLAVGDASGWSGTRGPLPKAGVHAVRMGPVLTHNLRALLSGGALRAHVPQRRALALLATGDDRAIAAWGPLWAQGRWVWRWKDHIDRGFVQGFARRPGAAPCDSRG